MSQYVALLRGINVGGKHKLPMVDLRKELKSLGYKNVHTLLNSGNIIFDSSSKPLSNLEQEISDHLEQVFGFSIPVLIRNAKDILNLIARDPFKEIILTKDLRLYTSFLKENSKPDISLPWSTEDESYKILEVREKVIYSVLDLSVTKTTKGMDLLEQMFGNSLTTRNWNTIIRIGNKL